jgi:hypothetical protein
MLRKLVKALAIKNGDVKEAFPNLKADLGDPEMGALNINSGYPTSMPWSSGGNLACNKDGKLGSLSSFDGNPRVSAPLPKVDDYLDDYHERFKQYICGLLDPEYAHSKGVNIKIPSPLPIPSTTFTQVSSFTINTHNNGFWLVWNPSFPCTKSGVSKFKFYRDSPVAAGEQYVQREVFANYAASCFYGTNNQDLNFHYDQLPDVEVSRMRLVSAKMKVTYRGSSEKLAGKIVSCATFQPMPNVVAHDKDGVKALYFHNQNSGWYRPLPNTMLAFAIKGYSAGTHIDAGNLVSDDPDYTDVLKSQAVINGIWSKSLNLSDLNRGVTCTYLPIDTDSTIFTTPGTIRGSSLSKLIDRSFQNNNATMNDFSSQIAGGDQDQEFYIDNVGSPIVDLHGGRMGFIVVGEGLPDENTAIDVEFFYNWEILPTVNSASSMRNYSNSFLPSSVIYSEIMSGINIGDASITVLKNVDLTNPVPLPQKLGWSFGDILKGVGKFVVGGIENALK